MKHYISILGEGTLGASLFTMQWWSPFMDNLIYGAHAVTAICGMIIGIDAVRRLVKRIDRDGW